MDRANSKKEFRIGALARRDSLTAKERREYSEEILQKLTALPCYQQADAVLTYISFRSEVDTFFLLERALADKKAVFAPRVMGREMTFFRIYGKEDLSKGYQGILEPQGGMSYTDWVSQMEGNGQYNTLICLPGAAFDRARHRIGYGGGFYDRYLSGHLKKTDDAFSQVMTAALAFSCQIFEEIPWEICDICPERIVTETENIEA